MSMKAEAFEASKVGVFGMILIGLCSLLLGIVSRLFSQGPIIYVSSMAGVLFPMVMVTVGALALWARVIPVEYDELPEIGLKNSILSSLAAGLMAASGGAFLLGITLMLPLQGILPFDGLFSFIGGLDVYGYLEIAILIATYVALSAIGGMLYGIVFPVEEEGMF